MAPSRGRVPGHAPTVKSKNYHRLWPCYTAGACICDRATLLPQAWQHSKAMTGIMGMPGAGHRGVTEHDSAQIVARSLFFRPKGDRARGHAEFVPAAAEPVARRCCRSARYGLGTHPDIIERLWDLDTSRNPAAGSSGANHRWSIRRPAWSLQSASAPSALSCACRLMCSQPGTSRGHRQSGAVFRHRAGSPEWRFVAWQAPAAQWCRAAYALR